MRAAHVKQNRKPVGEQSRGCRERQCVRRSDRRLKGVVASEGVDKRIGEESGKTLLDRLAAVDSRTNQRTETQTKTYVEKWSRSRASGGTASS